MVLAVMGVAGGLAIFLFGLQLVSDGLKGAAGHALRVILDRITATKTIGFLVGGAVTFLLQSSIVTTVVLVGLAGAGMIAFSQTLPVILGANVGATLTVQLVAFKVADYSLLAIFIGYVVRAGARRKRVRYIGDVIMGFGLLFYGMHIMTLAVEPIQKYEGVAAALVALGGSPFWSMVAGMVFTAVVRSSAAAIGFVMSLAVQGLMGISGALPFMLGANIGTCVSAVLAAIGGGTSAKRVATGHVFFKVAGVALIWPFLTLLEEFAVSTASGLPRQIANAHTAFNILIAVVFMPFTNQVAQLIERVFPDRAADLEEGLEMPVFLDRETVQTAPSLAIDQAERETLRLAGIVQDMVDSLALMVEHDDQAAIEAVSRREEAVDNLFHAITTHLTDISEGELERYEVEKVIRMLYVVNDLEHIGDLAVNVLHTQRKRIADGLTFSDEGKEEILKIHRGVAALLREAVKAFEEDNPVRARAVMASLPYFFQLEQRSRLAHLGRLQARLRISRETSSIHLDVIDALVRIASHAGSIAQVLLPQAAWAPSEEDELTGEDGMPNSARQFGQPSSDDDVDAPAKAAAEGQGR